MRKFALVLATAATLAVTAVATAPPAHARYYGYGPGIVGGLVAGALIAGIASSAYGYGTTAVIIPHIRYILHITADTIPDITAVTSTGGLTTATGTFTRQGTSTTAAPRYYGGWHRHWRHW